MQQRSPATNTTVVNGERVRGKGMWASGQYIKARRSVTSARCTPRIGRAREGECRGGWADKMQRSSSLVAPSFPALPLAFSSDFPLQPFPPSPKRRTRLRLRLATPDHDHAFQSLTGLFLRRHCFFPQHVLHVLLGVRTPRPCRAPNPIANLQPAHTGDGSPSLAAPSPRSPSSCRIFGAPPSTAASATALAKGRLPYRAPKATTDTERVSMAQTRWRSCRPRCI